MLFYWYKRFFRLYLASMQPWFFKIICRHRFLVFSWATLCSLNYFIHFELRGKKKKKNFWLKWFVFLFFCFFQDLAVVVLLILIPLISPNSSKGGVKFSCTLIFPFYHFVKYGDECFDFFSTIGTLIVIQICSDQT